MISYILSIEKSRPFDLQSLPLEFLTVRSEGSSACCSVFCIFCYLADGSGDWIRFSFKPWKVSGKTTQGTSCLVVTLFIISAVINAQYLQLFISDCKTVWFKFFSFNLVVGIFHRETPPLICYWVYSAVQFI